MININMIIWYNSYQVKFSVKVLSAKVDNIVCIIPEILPIFQQRYFIFLKDGGGFALYLKNLQTSWRGPERVKIIVKFGILIKYFGSIISSTLSNHNFKIQCQHQLFPIFLLPTN